jgi:hypothetical protein
LLLFDKGFLSRKTTIKECVLEAMPEFPRDVADLIEQTVKDHVEYDAGAKDTIRRFNLTQLEAESVLWWTADVSTLSSMNTEESPYYVYNSHLRARDAHSIRLWRDYSFFFVSALHKLPPVETTSFRGEKKRVTELSNQYAKENQVKLFVPGLQSWPAKMDTPTFWDDTGIIVSFFAYRLLGYRSPQRRLTASRLSGSLVTAEHF